MHQKPIRIISFGQHQVEKIQMSPCPIPDRQTLHLQLDVRLIPDPKPVFPRVPGTDPRVSSFVLTSAEALELLPGYWAAITGCLPLLGKSERYTALHVHVMCGGGFQRSVAVAEHFAAKASGTWIRSDSRAPPAR